MVKHVSNECNESVVKDMLTGNTHHRRRESNVMQGCMSLCCLSALVTFLSILLLHAMSSVWLDPVRNLKLNEEFVYITVALATVSASLNFCAMATFSVQIYLVYTDHRQDEYIVLRYLQEVSTLRSVASLSVFISIPIFITSFACYIYMEFRRMAALLAISIMGVACLYLVFALLYSYCKWNRVVNATSDVCVKYNAYQGTANFIQREVNPESNCVKEQENNLVYSNTKVEINSLAVLDNKHKSNVKVCKEGDVLCQHNEQPESFESVVVEQSKTIIPHPSTTEAKTVVRSNSKLDVVQKQINTNNATDLTKETKQENSTLV